jgi:hypothetical protein
VKGLFLLLVHINGFYNPETKYWDNIEDQNPIEWDEVRNEEIEELVKNETIGVHMEMMIYSKIWKANHFLKNLINWYSWPAENLMIGIFYWGGSVVPKIR